MKSAKKYKTESPNWWQSPSINFLMQIKHTAFTKFSKMKRKLSWYNFRHVRQARCANYSQRCHAE